MQASMLQLKILRDNFVFILQKEEKLRLQTKERRIVTLYMVTMSSIYICVLHVVYPIIFTICVFAKKELFLYKMSRKAENENYLPEYLSLEEDNL